jgi:hypothetical protein
VALSLRRFFSYTASKLAPLPEQLFQRRFPPSIAMNYFDDFDDGLNFEEVDAVVDAVTQSIHPTQPLQRVLQPNSFHASVQQAPPPSISTTTSPQLSILQTSVRPSSSQPQAPKAYTTQDRQGPTTSGFSSSKPSAAADAKNEYDTKDVEVPAEDYQALIDTLNKRFGFGEFRVCIYIFSTCIHYCRVGSFLRQCPPSFLTYPTKPLVALLHSQPLQLGVIYSLLKGRDVCVFWATGSGEF